MSDTPVQPEQELEVAPFHIWELMSSFHKSAALKTALELEVFTAIAEGKKTAQEIGQRCKASERGIRILCDYLVVNRLLKKKDQEYSLPRGGELFLNKNSPVYMGEMHHFLISDFMLSAMSVLTESVRKGGTAYRAGEGSLFPDNPVWVSFARSMAALLGPVSEKLAGLVASPGTPQRVLDVAAGHGVHGVAIAKRNPQAHITAVEWEPVLVVARENAQKAGVSDRYSTIPGNAFEVDYGTGYDLVLATNFFHHFDPKGIVTLMRKMGAALKPGGKLLTLDLMPNDDRVTPPAAGTFPIVMLSTTPGGDSYTVNELKSLLDEAGFTGHEVHETIGPERIIISRKK
jgi:SAM-dependent methyltransferase